MKITCVRCDNHFEEDEIKYAFEEPYCCDCFDERFTYCTRCDVIISNDDARYNDDGYAYCDECFVEEDDFSPEEFDPFNIKVQLYEAS